MRTEILFATNNAALAENLNRTSHGRRIELGSILSQNKINALLKNRISSPKAFLFILSPDELSDIFDLDLDKKFEKVDYLKEQDAFACTFQNGKSYLLNRKDVPEESGSKVKSCTIDKDGYYFIVGLESGEKYTIPWDFVLHRCEPGYEFYKDKPVDALSPREIGDRIAKVRKSKGITQEKLSKSTGILRANIARIESGRHNPSLETLHRIAKALKAPVAALLAK